MLSHRGHSGEEFVAVGASERAPERGQEQEREVRADGKHELLSRVHLINRFYLISFLCRLGKF